MDSNQRVLDKPQIATFEKDTAVSIRYKLKYWLQLYLPDYIQSTVAAGVWYTSCLLEVAERPCVVHDNGSLECPTCGGFFLGECRNDRLAVGKTKTVDEVFRCNIWLWARIKREHWKEKKMLLTSVCLWAPRNSASSNCVQRSLFSEQLAHGPSYRKNEETIFVSYGESSYFQPNSHTGFQGFGVRF